jgi:hypothetical protein
MFLVNRMGRSPSAAKTVSITRCGSVSMVASTASLPGWSNPVWSR